MKLTYDETVDALYIRFIDAPVECIVSRLNDRFAVNFGPDNVVVGIEVLDASEVIAGIRDRKVRLENLTVAP